MVLGRIGGWTPPFQLTLTQVGVIIGVFLIEVKTWRWWALVLPPAVTIMLAVGLPLLLGWVVRRTRIEGRSLPRYLLGRLSLFWVPKLGQVRGRPHRYGKAARPGAAWIYVAALPAEWATATVVPDHDDTSHLVVVEG